MPWSWAISTHPLNVTASVGGATATAGDARPLDLDRLMTLADERLYVAKRAGRDRVAVASRA